MISKISKLEKIGKFSYITQERDFNYGGKGQNCNIVFGFNGSGKTTLSNAISFFADNSFISEEEKKEIFDDIKNEDNSVVELSLQGNSNIKYPASSVHSKNFYIFNSNFVATHVFNGTKGRLKKFSNIGGEIKNKEIDTINQQIETIEEEKKKLESKNKKFDEKHEEITKEKSKGFGKTLTDKNKRLQTQDLSNVQLSNSTIEELEVKLSSLSADYELSKKQDDLNTDLEELRQLTFDTFSLDIENVDENILSKNIQQLSKDVLEKKIAEIQNLFSDEQHQQGVERWFKYGKDVLEKVTEHKGKNCPICSTDISSRLGLLLQGYQGYFDESYEKFISELKTKTDEVASAISLLDQYEKNAEKLDKLFTKYEKLLSQLVFEKFDSLIVKNDLTTLEKALKTKNDNIQSVLSKPADVSDNLTKLNDALTKLQNLKTGILSVLESKKLNTHTIEENIRQTCNEIIVLEFNNLNNTGALEKYRNNKKNQAFHSDIFDLIIPKIDLVYIDTPYISAKGVGVNYFDFYHFLEGTVFYDEWSKLIDEDSKHKKIRNGKNEWCNKGEIHGAFERLFDKFKNSMLVVSYRDDGTPTISELVTMLKKHKKSVEVKKLDYKYVLSNGYSKEVLIIAQ